ncbi:cytochrome P450 [Kitasatospora sp. GAS204A]|uniref:cytochrome P450 n=1 Tax=unclassified Kitasatospora TaxID=2633591 RepID=UPI002476367D|nr:cytochrome P450 [Kitasatospora sp. GAS204B]MDH6117070.1 cytochrome P450 [Kitasatospora sp. GAS204B]
MVVFDPLNPEMLEDPYSVYARLRSDDPVHWHDGLKAWVVTGYRDCLGVLQNPEAFSCDFRKIGDAVPQEFLSIQTVDPPLHEAIRKPIIAALRKMDIAAWLDGAATAADALMHEVDHDGFDFIEFLEQISARTMCTFLGIPGPADEGTVRAAQRDLILSMDAGLDPERAPAGVRARGFLSDIIEPWLDQPKPGGFIDHVEFDKSADMRHYLVNSLRNFFVAGYSSTSSTLGSVTATLLRHGTLAAVEPATIDAVAMNELVRHSGAVQAVSRAVVRDVRLPSGHQVDAGDVVIAVVASANRDGTAFRDADELRLDRSPNPHLGFGRGVHACTGTHLAVALGSQVLTRLSRKFVLKQAGSAVRRPTGTLRGFDRLPVRLIRR